MDLLQEIHTARQADVSQAKKQRPASGLESDIKKAEPPRDFRSAISQAGRLSLIAEMKKKSPSAGIIRENYVVKELASAYERGGAQALSVLTEPHRFEGLLDDLTKARAASKLPILRKDFIFDPYQMLEARAYGADAALLIAEMVDKNQLKELVAAARSYQLEPLVEIFLEKSIDAALDSGATLIGINTRNLRTLEMVKDNVAKLAPHIPKDRIVIGESGIKSAGDVDALKALKVAAILVGESLLKHSNQEEAVRTLVQAGGNV